MLVDRRALVVEIVGADDRGVAAGVAAADPALLEHGDLGEAVLLGQVVGRGEAVPAAADDHRVVGGFRLRRAPLALPALVTDKCLGQERAQREAMHRPPKIARRQGSWRLASASYDVGLLLAIPRASDHTRRRPIPRNHRPRAYSRKGWRVPRFQDP